MLGELDVIKQELRTAAVPEQALQAPRYFKAGPGEYAEGDQFLGVPVPSQRAIAKQHRHVAREDIEQLLHSHWHEERLTALFIMVDRYNRGNELNKAAIYELYTKSTLFINNWDLVDSSAPYIVGPQLEDSPYRMKVLEKLAGSELLWERRIAMLSTLYYITKRGRADEALVIAEILLHDGHDLIQKAVGWMLREIGKRIDVSLLEQFLDQHAATMPRTTLRYAIEHFTPERKRYYMDLGKGTMAV